LYQKLNRFQETIFNLPYSGQRGAFSWQLSHTCVSRIWNNWVTKTRTLYWNICHQAFVLKRCLYCSICYTQLWWSV